MKDIVQEIHRSASSPDHDEAETAKEIAKEHVKDVPQPPESDGATGSGLTNLIVSHLPISKPGRPEKPARPSLRGTINEEIAMGDADANEEPALEVEAEPARIHTLPAAPPDGFGLDTDEAAILISIIHD
ncbi:hypothetical protein HPP92_003696 [Vanilla planifolia]|uniref:Uncharacterized protein n=1 Tax=Vanilla planifolia TaxID=51239 RepID=A0A835S292_VANPL|nr:hypothetical protein HPP92_003696 [Vanilla planifolia]